jgi:hypothetical protein
MSRLVVKCPQCEHQEMILSSRSGVGLPPCPRCDGFVRMENVTPTADETKQAWSTAGSKATSVEKPGSPTPPKPVRRDQRDPGPEPRN